MRAFGVCAVCVCVALGWGCDGIRTSEVPGGQKRSVPMKIDTDSDYEVMVSHRGTTLGSAPVVVDTSSFDYPITIRAHFAEGSRDFTLEKYEPIVTLEFAKGAITPEQKLRSMRKGKK